MSMPWLHIFSLDFQELAIASFPPSVALYLW
jgi:hypothetical protein